MDQNAREQQAEREAARTAFAPGVSRLLVVVFLLAITVVPVVDLIREPQTAAAFFSLLPARFEMARVLDEDGPVHGALELSRRLHRNMEQFEDTLERQSILRETLVPRLNPFLTGIFGLRNADVLRGRDGWLFYGPGVDHLTGPPYLQRYPEGESPLAALTAFHEQLAARGVRLVVMPIPVKASIYPERLAAGYDGATPVYNPSDEALSAALRARGVLVCDPGPALAAAKAGGETYLAGDSHWTPWGQQVAVQYLTDFLKQHTDLPDGATAYTTGASEAVRNAGDLVALLAPGADGGGGEAITLAPVVHPDGTAWTPDSESAVLLLGDSYANIFALKGMGWGTGAGMAAQLSLALQAPVDAITQNADGAFATRLALNQELERGRDRLAGKKVLVFAFSARELSLGNWKLARTLATPAVRDTAPQTAAPITLTGIIAEQSMPPEPGSVPYRDCLIAAHLTQVQGAPGLPDSMLVYRWGMRDNVWTPAARQRSGESVRISIQPWDTVAAELGSYNRAELEADAPVNLPIWWEVQEPSTGGSLPAILRALEPTETLVHTGDNGWLFFLPELRFLAAGPFWGADAVRVSRASNPEFADPLPAILDFQRQLDALGTTLLIAPVPAKATWYGAEGGVGEGRGAAPEALATFLELLATSGVHVVDLTPTFAAARAAGGPALYCRQDTHWSPYAIALAAEAIAAPLRDLPWYPEQVLSRYPVDQTEITIQGDLSAMLPEPRPEPETLPLWRVGGDSPILPDRQSPVLLIGDSHNLVFHAGGDMHAVGAGLPDHLAASLGFAIDLEAVRGSGATAPRINLARRRDNLAGKRAVIWCFTVREFTESNTGWRPVQVAP